MQQYKPSYSTFQDYICKFELDLLQTRGPTNVTEALEHHKLCNWGYRKEYNLQLVSHCASRENREKKSVIFTEGLKDHLEFQNKRLSRRAEVVRS